MEHTLSPSMPALQLSTVSYELAFYGTDVSLAVQVPVTKKVSGYAHLLLILPISLRADKPDNILGNFEGPLIRVVDASIPCNLKSVAIVCAPGPDVIAAVYQIGDEHGSVAAEVVSAIAAFVMRLSFVQVQRDLHRISRCVVDQNSCALAQR